LIRAVRFRAVAGHKPQPVARVTLRPASGMPLLIEKREPASVVDQSSRNRRKAS
jgi:hypothetical protein